MKKYSKDEKRVAEWLNDKTGIGGGDDPIGFLLLSHEVLGERRAKTIKAINFLIEKHPHLKEDFLNLLDIIRFG